MPTWSAAPSSEASIPWYETAPTQATTVCTPQASVLSNPYLCTLLINVPQEEVRYLKNLYSPLLQGIDPAFQLVRIQDDEDTISGSLSPMDWEDTDLPPTLGLVTQSLSIVLFLRDDSHSQLRAAVAKSYLDSSPWKFHHKIELTSRFDFRTVARQEFYECAPRHFFPLWSVCSIHCGNEQLRFNLFVRDLERMKEFYSLILGKQVNASKPGFCSFRIYYQPGLEIQLSLKYSPCLLPEPTAAAQLCFRVKDIGNLRRVLPYDVIPGTSGTWSTRDVDGNPVVLIEDTSDIDLDYSDA